MTEEKPIALRAYAKLKNVTPMVITRAVRSGRLTKAAVFDKDGKVLGILASVADVEWSRNTDYTDSPQKAVSTESPEAGSLADAAAKQKYWQAQLSELKYRKEAKTLVPADEIKQYLTDTFTNCKTHILSIPSRIKQELPKLTLEDMEKVEKLVRECVTELSERED